MKKILLFVIFALLVITLMAKPLKVAFVYVGPIGDHGWTYAHDLGRRHIEKVFGNKILTAYLEGVPDGMASKKPIESLVKKGYRVIFTTSFGYMDATYELAQKYPDVYFLHCSGFKYNDRNMVAYFGRMYQPSFLAGIVAGAMTETNIIGYVAPIPIPEVVRITNAFALGVKLVNPKAKIHVVWTHSWYDPAMEKEAALSLIDLGADVIAQQTDSSAPVQTGEEKGVYTVGYNSDMSKFGPHSHLVSPIWNWGAYYEKVINEIFNGTFKGGFYWGGMDEGIVTLTQISKYVPENIKRIVDVFARAIKHKDFDPFEGPIYDQEGKLRVKTGEKLSDEELLSMMWFVDNIVGTIPKGGE